VPPESLLADELIEHPQVLARVFHQEIALLLADWMVSVHKIIGCFPQQLVPWLVGNTEVGLFLQTGCRASREKLNLSGR
jgi:hypothetical protein